MLFLLSLLTVAYFAVVLWVRRTRRSGAAAVTGLAAVAVLPEDDQPPVTAVGWPPSGTGFTTYVDDGFEALDAYLSEGAA